MSLPKKWQAAPLKRLHLKYVSSWLFPPSGWLEGTLLARHVRQHSWQQSITLHLSLPARVNGSLLSHYDISLRSRTGYAISPRPSPPPFGSKQNRWSQSICQAILTLKFYHKEWLCQDIVRVVSHILAAHAAVIFVIQIRTYVSIKTAILLISIVTFSTDKTIVRIR